jgi:hypothetical protein
MSAVPAGAGHRVWLQPGLSRGARPGAKAFLRAQEGIRRQWSRITATDRSRPQPTLPGRDVSAILTVVEHTRAPDASGIRAA